MQRRIWVFFYGSFINQEVLRSAGVAPIDIQAASLTGFDIRIGPLANLVPAAHECVYGIVARATHSELATLYDYARDTMGGNYLPEAVLVSAPEAKWLPALCYIAPEMEQRQPTADYVDRIVGPAKELGFPTWYIDRLEQFRPKT